MKRMLHIIITVISVGFLVWFIAPMAYGVRNLGTVLGILICLALIFRFGFSKYYMQFKTLMLEHGFTKFLMRFIQFGAFAFLIYTVAVSGFMIYAMTAKPAADSTAVVLGAQVKPWGASSLLRQRIDAAQTYLEENPATVAVVTGGKGSDEPMSEAQCMHDELVKAGIAEERIVMEDKATNTYENLRFSLALIREKELSPDLAIITDSYHQLRARIIAKKADSSLNIGAVNAHNNHVGLAAYPTYFVREWLAIPVEFFK